jgi:hypothetical protein
MCSGDAFLPFQLFLRGVRTGNLYFCDLVFTGLSSSVDDFAIISQAGVAVWLTSRGRILNSTDPTDLQLQISIRLGLTDNNLRVLRQPTTSSRRVVVNRSRGGLGSVALLEFG